MKSLTTRQSIVFTPTPEQVAELFESMDADQQAIFFNHLADRFSTWEHPFCFQLQALSDSDLLTYDARYVMEQIGEYAKDINDY